MFEIRQYTITFETLLHRSGCDIDNALDEWTDIAVHVNSKHPP